MSYLALLLSLPTRAATGRMRVWRALKGLGCATLRDGVYLLPDTPEHAGALAQVGEEAREVEGSAEVYRLEPLDLRQEGALRALFDRGEEYAALVQEAQGLLAELAALEAAGAQRRLLGLERRLEQITRIDFFPGDAQPRAAAVMADLRRQLTRHFCPDEPSAADAEVPRLSGADYQGRTWATRARPWVDRLASAWLIRSHIDPRAAFVWLASPAACRPEWLGFDFDGAAFTHVGPRVTFETLLASFGLDTDPALARLAGLVHYLDVGGVPVAEAAGVEALLSGLRAGEADDDRLLDLACTVFEGLLRNYRERRDE